MLFTQFAMRISDDCLKFSDAIENHDAPHLYVDQVRK